jgi:hypothetical protein
MWAACHGGIREKKATPPAFFFVKGLCVQVNEDLMSGLDQETASAVVPLSPALTSAKNDIKELTLGLDFCTEDLHKSNLGKLESNLK